MTPPTHDSTPTRPLTDRQERFIHEYMIDQNASAAALRCGYSPGSCRAQGAALMRDARIRERVTEGLEELFERLDVTAARVLGERARAAFFDPLCLIDAKGEPVPLHELGPEVKAALVISYRSRGGVPELFVRHVNRNPALTVLERQLAHLEALKREREEAELERAAEAQRQAEEALRAAQGPVRLDPPQYQRRWEPEVPVGSQVAAQGVEVEPPVPVAPVTVMAEPARIEPVRVEPPRPVLRERADAAAILPVLDYPEPDIPRATFARPVVAPGQRVGVPRQRSQQKYAITEDNDPWGD